MINVIGESPDIIMSLSFSLIQNSKFFFNQMVDDCRMEMNTV